MRLDAALVARGLAPTRSQAESYVRLGKVQVNAHPAVDAGILVGDHDRIALVNGEQYVSRAGLKLASVADVFGMDFRGKVVLDVGSSTGGFTDYALQHGAKKVIAVDKGTNQLHPTLRNNPAIELHEKTDIRDFRAIPAPDIVLVDVSFVSLRDILPGITASAGQQTQVVAMVKPQFEVADTDLRGGVIKNDRVRRDVLRAFETWVMKQFVVVDKADSAVRGSKGNEERFYLLRPTGGRR